MSARRYLLVAVIAFAAAMAGVWAARTWRASPAHGEGQIHQLLHRDMTLDSRQQQRIAALEARFAQRRAGLEAQMRAINGQLAQDFTRGEWAKAVVTTGSASSRRKLAKPTKTGGESAS